MALSSCDISFFSNNQTNDEELKKKILKVKSYGPKIVVATCRCNWSMTYEGTKFYDCGIIECEHVVDTMRTGDSYIAGFLLSYLSEKPIEECMLDGAKNSAVTIAYNGAW